MSRSIPPFAADVLEQLELEQPELVTKSTITKLLKELNAEDKSAKKIIHRLSEEGWLLKTDVKGVWEFAPANRAGPYSSNDPWLALRAYLLKKPNCAASVALSSAMWLYNYTDRLPSSPELAIPTDEYTPKPLKKNYRICGFEANLTNNQVEDLPVHKYSSILIHLAHTPTQVRDWGAVLNWLPKLVKECEKENIIKELHERPKSTHIRLAYLISDLEPKLISELQIEPKGVVRFGPRNQSPKRTDENWNIVDSLLPYHPSKINDES